MNNAPVIKRRTFIVGTVCSALVPVATSSVSAYAASPQPSATFEDLSVEVTDPPFNWDTFEDSFEVPLYAGEGDNRKIADVAFPQAMVITNHGTIPATNPTGVIITQMRDTWADVASVYGSDQISVNSTDQRFSFTRGQSEEKGSGEIQKGGAVHTWIYRGVLQPGESVTVPLRYYAAHTSPNLWVGGLWNVEFELFVSAAINTPEGKVVENSLGEKMGRTQGGVKV